MNDVKVRQKDSGLIFTMKATEAQILLTHASQLYEYYPLPPDKFLEAMKSRVDDSNPESAKRDGEALIVVVLNALGYKEGMDIFLQMKKY